MKIYTKQIKILLLLYFIIGTGFVLLRPIYSDEGYYILAARNILNGKLLYVDFVFHQLPLLPYLYAPFSKLGMVTYFILKYFSVFSTLGLAILLYKQVLKVTSDYKSAYFAVFLLIVHGTFVDFNTVAKMVAPANFLCFLSFYLVTLVEFNSSVKDKVIVFSIGLISALTSNMRIMYWSVTFVIVLYLGYAVFKKIKPVEQKLYYFLLIIAGILIPSLITLYYFFTFPDYFIFGVFRHNLYSQQYHWADLGSNWTRWLKFFFMPQNFLLFVFMLIGLTQKFKYKTLAIMFFITIFVSHSGGYFINEYLTVVIPYAIYIGAVNYRFLEEKLIYKRRPVLKYMLAVYILSFFITVPYFRYAFTGRIMEPNLLQLESMIEHERSLKGEKILSSWDIYTLYSNKVNDTLKNGYVYSTMIDKLSPEEIRKFGLPDSSLISNLIKEKHYDVIMQNETSPHVLLRHKEIVKEYYKLDTVIGNTYYFIK